jgi:hypothetical protein
MSAVEGRADIRTFAARGNMSPGQRAMATTMLYPKTQSLKRKGAGSVAATDPGVGMVGSIQAASVGGLFHDSLDNGPRGAWSSPPVR